MNWLAKPGSYILVGLSIGLARISPAVGRDIRRDFFYKARKFDIYVEEVHFVGLFELEVSVVCPKPWQDRMTVWTFIRSYHEVPCREARQYLDNQQQKAMAAVKTPAPPAEYYFNWNFDTEDNP